MNNVFYYDIEVYLNLFMTSFLNHEDINISKTFIVYKNKDTEINDLLQLYQFINNSYYFIGYNNSNYDNLILNYILSMFRNFRGVDDILTKIYRLSSEIIDSNYYDVNDFIVKLKYYKAKYTSIDLMKVFSLDKRKKSLKQTAININYPNIQDLPIPPDSYIDLEQLDIIKQYNINDCKILYHILQAEHFTGNKNIDELKMRFVASDKYKVNLYSAGKSTITDKLFSKLYCEKENIPYFELSKKRTFRRGIKLSDCIPDVSFNSKEFNNLLNEIKNTVITSENKLDLSVIYSNTKYELGLGGLHSKDFPKYFKKTSDYHIIDCDVTSFYPFIMLLYRIKPKHLTDSFFEILEELIEFRVNAKKNYNPDDESTLMDIVISNVLKIVINTIFGKLGFEFSYFFDMLAMYKVTIHGQLLLLKLVEMLSEKGIQVISANTDGIVSKIHKDKLDDYYNTCNEWCKLTRFNLEFTEYVKYVRRDVNNYLAETTDGKIKRKGDLNKDLRLDLEKGFDMPIVAECVEEYFINNVPVLDTIKANIKNIYKFCKTQNISGKFQAEYHKLNDDKTDIIVEKLQKNIRFYVSNSGGVLVKRSKEDNKIISILAGKNVTIFNQYFDADDYNIDIRYYYSEAKKIIDIIQYGLNTNKKIKGGYGTHTGSLFDDL